MLCYQQNPDFRKFVRKLSSCRTIASLDVDENPGEKNDLQRKHSNTMAPEEGVLKKHQEVVNKVVDPDCDSKHKYKTISSKAEVDILISVAKATLYSQMYFCLSVHLSIREDFNKKKQ